MKTTLTTVAIVAAWVLLYGWRAIAGHLDLATNAYDLSVFDYSIWNLTYNQNGWVPFYGYSIFSDHFMPVLALLVPVHWLFPSPVLLLLLQVVSTAVAALLLKRLAQAQGLTPWFAIAVMVVFLMARRTHSAVASQFYPEAFQAPLILGMVLAWTARPWILWPAIVLLLSTKEDAALYVAAFAVFSLWMRYGSRRRAVIALSIAIVWLALAFFVFIPMSRAADGLAGSSNPVLQARFGSNAGEAPMLGLFERLFSAKTGSTLANLALSTGFLALGGISWLAPAVPGLLANIVAAPEHVQSSLNDHYAWPILPWLFLAMALGAARLHQRLPKLAIAVVGVLLIATVADNPAVQRVFTRSVSADAQQVREQLRRVSGPVVLAQANLIPQLPKTNSIYSVGSLHEPSGNVDLVLLTYVGNLWPYTREEIGAVIAKYRANADYVEVESGPLFAFVRKK